MVCGHIHKAEIRRFGDILYINDGDWVESCTAVAEREDGELIILDWSREFRQRGGVTAVHRLESEPRFAA